MSSVDLHVHTSASDGAWNATEVVTVAAQRNVDVLAITDHDCTDSLTEARSAAKRLNLQLVSGVELSAQWNGVSVHVVGLNIDASNEHLREALAGVRAMRASRARAMGVELERAGIAGAYEG
ncbi:MAG: PHP domain-containing protein, partial [Casimicrobium sp.]